MTASGMVRLISGCLLLALPAVAAWIPGRPVAPERLPQSSPVPAETLLVVPVVITTSGAAPESREILVRPDLPVPEPSALVLLAPSALLLLHRRR